mgnify:FL=1
MKTYNVTLRGTVYESYTVEANNVSQAIESATEDFKQKFADNVDDDSSNECED